MKVAILAGNDGSLVNFRGPLVRAMIAAGHEVVAMAPAENQVADKIAQLGARYVPIRLARAGLNPLADYRTRREIRRLLQREGIEVVLAYTIKPVVHGLPAARDAGVRGRYALITGLGAAFNTRGWKGWLLDRAATVLYRRALRDASAVMVQNADIAEFLKARGMIPPGVPLSVVPGSGVDLARHVARPLPSGAPRFVVLSRLLRDKGVFEFVEAARMVKARLPQALFMVVGSRDANPAAIQADQVARWAQEGVVQFMPHVEDVRPLLEACRACVLPSYHEGMPRSLLEGMATGRPIVATDVIGCRETVPDVGAPDADQVRQGANGFLVPVRAARPLAAAMLRLATDRELAEVMGLAGRALVEARFESSAINAAMLDTMRLSPSPVTTSP